MRSSSPDPRESAIDCIVAGQAFPGTDKVEIAVLDLGQTIRQHLIKNPKYMKLRDDRTAILKAAEEGVTGTPAGKMNRRGDPNSGAGLADLRAYCQSGGGQLTVLSGSAWITWAHGSEPTAGRLRKRFRGCLVNVRYFTGNSLLQPKVDPIL